MTTIPTPYYGGGQVPAPPDTIHTVGMPSSSVIAYPLGSLAIDNAAKTIYGLASKAGGEATWVVLGGTSAGAFPITPFVVGPSSQADYQTVQAGIDAANAAGGGMVYVQPGTYTENLTLYTDICLWGAGATLTVISGSHTPPDSGTIGFFRLYLSDDNHVISSSSAGTATIYLDNCIFSVQSGYAVNIPNWASGPIWITSCYVEGTNDGLVDNSAGAATIRIEANNSLFGNTNALTINGVLICDSSQIGGPITCNSGASITVSDTYIGGQLISNGTSLILNSTINTPALTSCANIGVNGTCSISNGTLISNATNAIIGTGQLKLLATTFTNSSGIDPGLTIQDTGEVASCGNLSLITPGSKFSIAPGTNATVGVSSLVAGTVTVSTTAVTANSLIFLTPQSIGTITTPAAVSVTAKTAGTSFVITSDANTDTSTVGWWIIN